MDQHETSPAVPEQRVSTPLPQLSDTGVERVDIQAHARPPHRYHLARGGLTGVVTAMEISRATMRNVYQNLFGAFIYNARGIPPWACSIPFSELCYRH